MRCTPFFDEVAIPRSLDGLAHERRVHLRPRDGHLFPEFDHLAAARLEAIRTSGLGATAVVGS